MTKRSLSVDGILAEIDTATHRARIRLSPSGWEISVPISLYDATRMRPFISKEVVVTIAPRAELERSDEVARGVEIHGPVDSPDPTHIYVENGMLTNVTAGRRAPDPGEPWQFMLLCHRDEADGEHIMVTVEGGTEREARARLAAFIAQENVILIEEPEEVPKP